MIRRSSTSHLERVCRLSCLVLVACLAFLIPFDASRNIDLQGIVLIIAGSLGWIAWLLSKQRLDFPKPAIWLLVVYMLACLVAVFSNPNIGYDLFGAPYLRLGVLGLLSCIGCGLVFRSLEPKSLVAYLYIFVSTVGVLSLPYSLIKFHSLMRLGGIFNQADVLACFLGAGLLLGFYMLDYYPNQRREVLGSQLFLVIMLILTQTRAVILLVAILSLAFWVVENQFNLQRAIKLIAISALALILVMVIMPHRLTNTADATASYRYRLTLQKHALQSSSEKPWLGYGPGNLADALACPKLPGQELQKTCKKGYFFNSSHNIFIDQILAVGWIGGTAFLLFVSFSIYRGFLRPETHPFAYVSLLIAGYYVTNVTSASLELLLFVSLFGCYSIKISRV